MFGIKTKLIITLIFLSIIGTIGTVGYFYYKNSQAQIMQLQENNAKLEIAVDEMSKTIDSLEKDIKLASEITTELNQSLSDARVRNRELAERLSRHDLGLLAIEKPQLVERIINNASKEALRCFELLSGAPLNEKEKNAKNEREFNSECSYLFNVYRNVP